MITSIYRGAANGQVLLAMYRRQTAGLGMGDINDDAMAAFNRGGVAASCKWVPYQGPIGGGHNVCDVVGDDRGAEFGAELIARPGGVDIYQVETANAAAYVAQRAAENKIIVENQRRLDAERANIVPVGQIVGIAPGVQHGAVAQLTALQTSAHATPVYTAAGPGIAPGLIGPTVVSTATGPVVAGAGAGAGLGLGIDFETLPWGWIAAGIGALFVLPKLAGAGAGGGR